GPSRPRGSSVSVAGRAGGVADRPVAPGRARPRLGRLDLAVLGRRVGLQGVDEAPRRGRDLLDRRRERRLVRPRRLLEPADLADVLQGGGAYLLVGGRRVEVEERLDAAAHGGT